VRAFLFLGFGLVSAYPAPTSRLPCPPSEFKPRTPRYREQDGSDQTVTSLSGLSLSHLRNKILKLSAAELADLFEDKE